MSRTWLILPTPRLQLSYRYWNVPPVNPVDQLLIQFPGGFSFEGWDSGDLSNTLDNIFPDNPNMKAQFTKWLICIRDVIALTVGIVPEELRFSVIEALWARGILKAGDLEGLSFEDFQDALVGSIAYDHAQVIWNNAQAQGVDVQEPLGEFTPVNPDGSLVNCIPPKHLSPLGPIAYLQDLLQVSEASLAKTRHRKIFRRDLCCYSHLAVVR